MTEKEKKALAIKEDVKMYCPLFRISAGQVGKCLKDKCAWWVFDDPGSGGCTVPLLVAWLERLTQRVG